MEELEPSKEMSDVQSPIFTHEMKSKLEPVIIVASVNVDEVSVKKLLFRLDVKKEFLIGRNPEANMDIKHVAISRNHCIVSFGENKPFIKNLSSVGIYVNKKYIKEKNETHFLNSGDEILLSSSYSDFILQFYESISEIPPKVYKTLEQNCLLINKKRKILHDLKPNVIFSKKAKQDSPKKDERKQLFQGNGILDEPFSEISSPILHKKFDPQVLSTSEEASNYHPNKDIVNKTQELRLKEIENETLTLQNFELTRKLEELQRIQSEESQELRSKLERAEELINLAKEELVNERSKLEKAEELFKLTKEELVREKSKLEKAEELINLGKEELVRELERAKRLENILEDCLLEKETLQKELVAKHEAEIQSLKTELVAKYEADIQSLHDAQIEREKELAHRNADESVESEAIIRQLNDELESVRQLLSVHEAERQLLEAEVQANVKDFAEVLESEAQCTICSEIFLDAVTLVGCFHTFCEFCITEWKKQKRECPVCRHKILKNATRRNFMLDSWIRSFVGKMPPSVQSARADLIGIRARQKASSAPNAREATSSTQVGVRHPVVQGAGNARADTSAPQAGAGLAVRPSSVSRSRPHHGMPTAVRGRRFHARARTAPAVAPRATPAPTSAAPSSFTVNALASLFLPAGSRSAFQPPQDGSFNILNQEPIYVAGESEPPPRPPVPHSSPINESAILISDEEDD